MHVEKITVPYGELEYGENSGATWEMCNIDVHPEHRRKGIGTALINMFEKRVREAGGRAVYVFTAGDNVTAQAFYRAKGYSLTFLPGFYGIGRDAYIGVKPLA